MPRTFWDGFMVRLEQSHPEPVPLQTVTIDAVTNFE